MSELWGHLKEIMGEPSLKRLKQHQLRDRLVISESNTYSNIYSNTTPLVKDFIPFKYSNPFKMINFLVFVTVKKF